MNKKYIEISFGAPYLVNELNDYKPNRLAVIQRTWQNLHGFDAEHRYKIDMPKIPVYSTMTKILAYTIYNPSERIESHWTISEKTNFNQIIKLVEGGLMKDDDCIQQWFDAKCILKLLKNANNWDQMIMAVDAINGGHEINEITRLYVDETLG